MTASIRPSVGSPYSRFYAVGGYRPARLVTNEEICRNIDSSDEWIRSRSGIVNRRFAAADETVVDMAVAAGGKAVAASGIDPERVDSVIVATCTLTTPIPAAGPQVAHRIGAVQASAFDLNSVCSGFSHAVAVADSLIRSGCAQYVLVIGADKFSPLIDPHDRGIAFIFGDGAGAVLLGPSQTPGVGPVVWGADGSQASAIAMNGDWLDKAPAGEIAYMTMNGPQVFRWASYEMARVAQQAVTAAGLTLDDLDVFIPHQANMRITDAMARALKLPERVAIARDIVDTGNTSAASIPLAMETLLERGEASSGDLALLIGFGAGLSFAAQVVIVP